MQDVVILEALRTPIGRYGGGLSNIRPDDLAGLLIHTLMQRVGLSGEQIDEVLLGCANQAGEDNRNVARMAALLADLPDSVPGVTVNRLCGSGLEAIQQGCRAIQVGDAQLVLAGGVESMSRAPLVLPKPGLAFETGHRTLYDSTLGWRFPNPQLEKRFPLESMGVTAENLAEEYEIQREEQDLFALKSHQKALKSWKEGRFQREVVSVPVPQKKGKILQVEKDEGPRADTSPEKLGRLRAVFQEGGTVTAGNSSSLNDGAALLLLASRQKAEELGMQPLAKIRANAVAGVDPTVMGIGPAPATRKALKRAGLRLQQLELVELNEAFAAQSLAVIKELGLDPARVNPNGGAIALGHPLGCSGARLAVTLVHEMHRRGAKLGLVSLCIGVGQGISTIFEAESTAQ